MEVAKCRSCGRNIVWATSPTGAALPIDARAISPYVLRQDGDGPVRAVKANVPGESIYVSHFLTCPQADLHSRGGR